jgi:uncharacterized protein (DUF1697 family)
MAKMATYVALLRGINVGGKAKVEMPRLKVAFERLGLKNVSTYINSGNVIFRTSTNPRTLVPLIETEIEKDFGLQVPVVLRSLKQMQAINAALPDSWLTDKQVRTDVMFLWEDAIKPNLIDTLPIRPEIDNVKYLDGTLIWHVTRENQTRSGLLKIMGTPLYKRMSIRNSNTLRKLCELMGATEQG